MSATIVCVLSNNIKMNCDWINHHRVIIPSCYEVLLVDNTTFFSAQSYSVIGNLPSNWRLVKNFLPLQPQSDIDTYLCHGSGLDLAASFVVTPHMITIDNDCFILDPNSIRMLVEIAKEGAVLAGWMSWFRYQCYPYILPFFAIYDTSLVRKWGLGVRQVSADMMLTRYRQFYNPQAEAVDTFANIRKGGYLDVGQYYHYEAVLGGYEVVVLDDSLLDGKVIHHSKASSTVIFSSQDPHQLRALYLAVSNVCSRVVRYERIVAPRV